MLTAVYVDERVQSVAAGVSCTVTFLPRVIFVSYIGYRAFYDPRAEQEVVVTRGEGKSGARRALKDLHEARRDLVLRRDKATQQLLWPSIPLKRPASL